MKPKYHWGDSISKSKVKSDTLFLPVDSHNEIDYIFINNLISAQIKLCISDVLNAKDLEISTTEDVIEPDYEFSNQLHYSPIAAEPYELYLRDDVTETVLIGCYRDKKHLEWILANNIYNIRLGKRKGSAKDHPECFNQASRLYLYNVKNPAKVSIFKIIDNKEMLGSELKDMNYPSKSPGKSYITFKIEKDNDNVNVNINITAILKSIENHINGTPVFIEPKEYSSSN